MKIRKNSAWARLWQFLFVRRRVRDIEDYLFEDGRPPFLLLGETVEQELRTLNQKLDQLAEKQGMVFTYGGNRFQLVKRTKRMKRDEDLY